MPCGRSTTTENRFEMFDIEQTARDESRTINPQLNSNDRTRPCRRRTKRAGNRLRRKNASKSTSAGSASNSATSVPPRRWKRTRPSRRRIRTKSKPRDRSELALVASLPPAVVPELVALGSEYAHIKPADRPPSAAAGRRAEPRCPPGRPGSAAGSTAG